MSFGAKSHTEKATGISNTSESAIDHEKNLNVRASVTKTGTSDHYPILAIFKGDIKKSEKIWK